MPTVSHAHLAIIGDALRCDARGQCCAKVRLGSTLVFAMAVLGSDLLSSLNLRVATECVKINTAQWVKINVT